MGRRGAENGTVFTRTGSPLSCLLRLGAASGLILGVSMRPASGEEVDARPAVEEPVPTVELEDLLRLPDGFGSGIETRQGSTKVQWLERFAGARTEIETAKKNLTRVEKELGSAAQSASSWQVSAPGASNPEASPVSIRLRNEVKKYRDEITEGGRRLRSLDVEADLAGVPQDWRG